MRPWGRQAGSLSSMGGTLSKGELPFPMSSKGAPTSKLEGLAFLRLDVSSASIFGLGTRSKRALTSCTSPAGSQFSIPDFQTSESRSIRPSSICRPSSARVRGPMSSSSTAACQTALAGPSSPLAGATTALALDFTALACCSFHKPLLSSFGDERSLRRESRASRSTTDGAAAAVCLRSAFMASASRMRVGPR